MRNPFVLAALVAVFAASPFVLADDDPSAAPGAMPPEMPEGREAFLTPVERPDLIETMRRLHRSLESYETPPPSTRDITALRDAWNAILKPRAKTMTRRVEKWLDRKRWLYLDGEDTPYALQPDQWRMFTRDMASLAAELAGSYKQYGTVKLKPKEAGLGTTRIYNPPRIATYGYGYPVLYGGLRDRQAAASRLGRYDSGSYWHLLNRFNYAWDWGYNSLVERQRYWRQREQATVQMFEDLRTELNATRDSLGANLLGMQALVAAMQNQEEERINDDCIPCKTKDETLVKMAETALDGMHDARLEAEVYQGRSTSGYSTLLRKWLRSQKAANKVLRIAIEEEEAAAEDEDEDAPSEDAAAGN